MRLRPLVGALSMIAFASAASGQSVDTSSANWVMPGCLGTSNDFRQGVCSGEVEALVVIGQLLPIGQRFCTPTGSTRGQAVRVVVAYIQQNPARTHEPFATLAVEALRRAWPC